MFLKENLAFSIFGAHMCSKVCAVVSFVYQPEHFCFSVVMPFVVCVVTIDRALIA